MSDVFERYDQFYKACTKMFSKALARILEDPNLHYKKKLEHMHRIDEYIDMVSRKKIGGKEK